MPPMFIEFPGHGMLINIDSIDHVRIETVRGKDRLLHKLVLYLTQNHVDAQNGNRRKYVVMKHENREEICKVWREIIDQLNAEIIKIETPPL